MKQRKSKLVKLRLFGMFLIEIWNYSFDFRALIEEIRELKKECNELCSYYLDGEDNSKNRTVQNLRKSK